MSNLVNLRKKRSTLKGQLTRFQTFLNNVVPANPDFGQVETRLAKTEGWLEEFNSIQFDIEALDTETMQTDQDNERDKFEEIYYGVISKAKGILAKIPKTYSDNSGENQSTVQNQIKLPQLDLPTFDGTLDKWLFYRDTFSSIIHSSTSINKIQKFHYLRLSLKDEAAEVISSLEVSAENYEIAWGLLLERYENKSLLINNHVKSLFNLTNITKENYSALRSMLDNISKHLRALEVLGQPVAQWDTLLIYLVTSKLDPSTRRDWESKNNTGDFPSFDSLLQFLKQKCRLLETLNLNISESHGQVIQRQKIKAHLSTNTYSCFLCKDNHAIYNCKKFLDLTSKERFNEAKRLELCVNCLRKNHATKDCKSGTCRTCDKRHHTLLHFLAENSSSRNEPENQAAQCSSHTVANHSSSTNKSYTLLSTAIVQTFDKFGKLHDCRVLLDSGSMSSFVTEHFCDRLQLTKQNASFTVSGIDQRQTTINKIINIKIQSKVNNYQIPVTCLILPKITEKLPCFSFDRHSLDIPKNITLADQHFDKPNQIDILLGADVFWELLKVGQIKLGSNKPTLQKTHFGWVVTGQIIPPPYSNLNNKRCNFITNEDLNKQVEKFWELEQIDNIKTFSQEETACEADFVSHFKREQNGRFVVSIPFKQSPELLGTSKEQAQKRFYNLERKLQQNPILKQRYSDFLEEYEFLNHMTKINDDSISDGYYMPHHAVVREDKTTTRLRVVFDASAPSSNGISLNQLQMTGPVLQDDLFSILLRFRKHTYVISADISKMYRQVMVTPEHRKYQKILWRAEPTNELSTYVLNTVTYGTTAASYLAIRCLNQLASESNYPIISDIIKSDFYVDDLLSGAESKQEAFWICKEISSVLKKGRFELRKWRSNDPSVIQGVCTDEQHSSLMDFGLDIGAKTLGLVWSSVLDVLKFSIKSTFENKRITKRTILSETAQIFDPLGLLSICTISAKIIIQQLWQLRISWDESVPLDINSAWLSFRGQLKYLNEINIPRQVICQNACDIQLHCFSDASTLSFGACCYVRSTNTAGNIQVNLLCSKSRVAPLKTTTIPRLELSAALLLAQLSDKVRSSMKIHFNAVFHWTDSTIVLSWIHSISNTWKIFVSNRVTQIQTLTEKDSWNYVNTKHNPADLISRGLDPKYLNASVLWWKGPEWLSKPEIEWPKPNFTLFSNENYPQQVSSEYKKSQVKTFLAIHNINLVNKYSSFVKLQRVTAYLLRFKFNCQVQKQERQIGPLTPQELESATLSLTFLVQHEVYSKEISNLNQSGSVNRKSKILALNPFLDSQEVIRVGGRLKLSQFEFYKRHPAVLPANHHFSILLAEHEHKRLLHAGPQTVLASLRERFWIISGRNLVKKITRRCIRCLRFNSINVKYMMGDLPRERVTPARPFINSGLDYCGPFTIRDRLTRNFKPIKAYVCLFVCLATKAIHLELVSDLSSNAFIAALRRFTSRRGKCVNLFSDNATNFTGSDIILRKFVEEHERVFQTELGKEGIHWHFIPPRSPHFGGLWEAGVKSCKHHIKRVLGNAILSFEEFATVLAQIEACLNSRPLHPLTTDPNDPNALTPSHFLIGENITAIPDSNYLETNENRLSRFQRLQKLLQHFWQRWSLEYLAELQTRTKWKQKHSELLKPGVLVLIREENAPPLKWALGRIMEVHKGKDDIVRVVEVGDVILKVNETDVIRFSTKEVLKCLRLSSDPVTLKIKRDPKIKATVRKHLLSVSGGGDSDKTTKIPGVHLNSAPRPEPAVHKAHQHARFGTTNGSCAEQEPLLGRHQEVPEENERLQWQPLAANEKTKGQPKFEAYMMTGEHILNISRMPQTATIVPKQQKKVDNLRYHNSHAHHLRHQQHNSVPNSPNEMDLGHRASGKSGPNSASTSPVSANKRDQHQHSPADPYSSNNYVRTSRSEDQLQGQNDLCSVSVANAEADEDVTSSLNTLLDTRPDSAGCTSESDRIVWTYNAPISDHHKFAHTLSNGSSSSHSNISPTSSSPLHSGSPASPTSVSSSVMSSQSGSRRMPFSLPNGPTGQHAGDYSVSEAVSNISSPDYHDDDSVGIRDCVMEISDHSDSDSTLLVSEPRQRQVRVHGNSAGADSDHRIVIQVKGPEKDRARQSDSASTLKNDSYGYQISGDSSQEGEHEEEGVRESGNKSSPLSSEDESDVESLHSFHYSPKAVDMPSAIRLAKRLYSLDGFKKSDVSRHLSKNNDFSRAVAEEYLKYFDFEKDTLDIALRKFLKQFSLTGETQERERVLVHFSKRYLDCNPGSFNSQDAVHTLTCAIMLLNTDLHGQNIGRKMTCNEFIENLAGLNECENFPREVLKQLYHAIKNYPLEWALDEENEEGNAQSQMRNNETINLGGNPFLDVPISANAVEYKKGYVMRKCCYEANAKRTPFHKRSWKMFYCTLRDLVLYLHKDENGFRKNQMGDNLHNAIRIHHALATKASDYTKKQYVFRLQTADQAEYLFQTSDSKELQSWIDTINFVCASFSAPPLEAAVGSQKKFQRPLLPCSHTKLNLREQLADHEERVMRLEAMLDDHRRSPPEKGSKSQVVQNYKEKEAYLNYEFKRYRTYAYMLHSKMSQYPELGISLAENSIGEVDEATGGVTLMDGAVGIVPPPIPDRPSPTVNRKGPE